MGKKKSSGVYNDFLDGEKLSDNAEIHTSLQSSTPLSKQDISAPPPTSTRPNGSNTNTSRAGKSQPKKPPLTHFLCLPLVTPTSLPQLRTSLSTLTSSIQNTRTLPPSAVRPPSTLHLTLAVMSLDSTTLPLALQHLRGMNLHAILREITHTRIAQRAAEDGTVGENLNAASLPDTEALSVELAGLKCMGKEGETSVLYVEARDGTGRLEDFARRVRGAFGEGGWMVDEGRELKLHGTVVNTIYAKREMLRAGEMEGGENAARSGEDGQAVNATSGTAIKGNEHRTRRRNSSRNLRFDARDLMQEYEDFVWAKDVKIDRVCLCKMGARKVWSGGQEGVGEVVDEVYEVVGEKGIFE